MLVQYLSTRAAAKRYHALVLYGLSSCLPLRAPSPAVLHGHGLLCSCDFELRRRVWVLPFLVPQSLPPSESFAFGFCFERLKMLSRKQCAGALHPRFFCFSQVSHAGYRIGISARCLTLRFHFGFFCLFSDLWLHCRLRPLSCSPR